MTTSQDPFFCSQSNCAQPLTGVSYFDIERDELENKYERMVKEDEELEAEWDRCYESTLTECMHGHQCKQGASCTVRTL